MKKSRNEKIKSNQEFRYSKIQRYKKRKYILSHRKRNKKPKKREKKRIVETMKKKRKRKREKQERGLI